MITPFGARGILVAVIEYNDASNVQNWMKEHPEARIVDIHVTPCIESLCWTRMTILYYPS
jgi:hypothetical protein